ncbi:MAG: class I SAM-dependent methyltransferase [Planctomycetes bacterium]|nr:class I SAM-dependent methyltransferase [Planctomycetota bacterium]
MELDDRTEQAHFAAQGTLGRMDNYYRWILRNFGPRVGRRVWDAGAGVGHVTALLAAQAELVVATEFTERNLEALRARFAGVPNVVVEFCDLTAPAALELARYELDTIVTLDVLEHLEDDAAALARYHEILRPGGALLIKVPAHPFLYGTVDEASLHFRRYEKRELREKLERAGFRVEMLRPMNAAATLPYFFKGRVLKKRSNFSGTIDQGRVGLYNRLMPWLERVERLVPPPFGLSLVAAGRKS